MKRRTTALAALAAFTAALAAVWLPAVVERARGGEVRAWRVQAPSHGNPIAGRTVYLGWCAGCHGEDGYGRGRPNLTRLQGAEPAFLCAWVSEPRMIHGGTRMPRCDLTPEEVRDVVAWLRSR